MPTILEIADIVLNILNEFREDAGCHESLLVASYEPAETNFFTELPPLNATEAAGALTLEAVVKDIVMPMLEPTSEVYSTLLSSTATHLAMWCEDDEFVSIKWRLINEYITLDPVGPLIDGNLVLQGAVRSPLFGPVLATIEFAADHEEEFSQVGRVAPWEMLLTPPEDDSCGAQFVLPVTLGDVEGTVRIIVFVDKTESNIPYDEDKKEGFDLSSPSFIPSIIYVNRVGGAQRPEEGEGRAVAEPAAAGTLVVSALCVAHSASDREQRQKEGFDLDTAVNISTNGMSLVDAGEFPFAFGVSHAETAGGAQGVEDAIFVQSESRDAMPAAPDGYELAADLSQDGDEGCTFLAVKSGPSPRFSKVLMFICQEEGVDVADHVIENVADTLGGGQIRMAPNSVAQAFGARVGLIMVDRSSGRAVQEPMPTGAGDVEVQADNAPEEAKQHDADEENGPEEELRHPGDRSTETPKLLTNNESLSFGEISDDDFDDDGADDDMAAIERLEQEKRELEIELTGARQSNVDIQKKAAIVLAKAGKDGAGARGGTTEGEGAEAATASTTNLDGAAEKERHYKETMELIAECNKRLKKEQEEYEQQALDLQTRLDDKEYKAEEIAASLRQFKREILTKAENSRTGKGVSHRLVKQFELAESKKDEDLEKVRLRNISLKTTLRKLEKMLRSREQLAEGLHMIDFEQLKIENQTWNEKIEERNEELAKLKRKKTSTVQVLTHIREKIRFIENENDNQRAILSETEREIVDNRNRLTSCKRDRDTAKDTNVDLKGQRGFATSDLLIMDFEQRKAVMDNLTLTLKDLRDRQLTLTGQVNKNNTMLNTIRTTSAPGNGSRGPAFGARKGGTSMF